MEGRERHLPEVCHNTTTTPGLWKECLLQQAANEGWEDLWQLGNWTFGTFSHSSSAFCSPEVTLSFMLLLLGDCLMWHCVVVVFFRGMGSSWFCWLNLKCSQTGDHQLDTICDGWSLHFVGISLLMKPWLRGRLALKMPAYHRNNISTLSNEIIMSFTNPHFHFFFLYLSFIFNPRSH